MKKVLLKEVTVGDGNPQPLNYLQQMISCLKQPENPQAGTNYDEMSRVMPIIKKLQGVEGAEFVLLEDAQHTEIVKRLKTLGFVSNDEALYDLITDVAQAEEVELEEVAKEA